MFEPKDLLVLRYICIDCLCKLNEKNILCYPQVLGNSGLKMEVEVPVD